MSSVSWWCYLNSENILQHLKLTSIYKEYKRTVEILKILLKKIWLLRDCKAYLRNSFKKPSEKITILFTWKYLRNILLFWTFIFSVCLSPSFTCVWTWSFLILNNHHSHHHNSYCYEHWCYHKSSKLRKKLC